MGGSQIGIDCLCKDTTKLYQDTPQEIRQVLKIDTLIFTHEHEDHFCAEYVKEAWEKNAALQIYSTRKVIACLEEIGIPDKNLRVIKDGDKIQCNDVQITTMETVHEGEQYADVQNLTLLMEIGNEKFVVTGDAMPCKELFENISLWSKQIDWFLAPFPYVGLRSTRKLMKEYLDIQNIFVLHLPRKEADVQGWTANTKRVCEVAKDGLPQPVFPECV